MKIENNIDLLKYSTMRTHSIGAVMYTPENKDEIIEIVNELKGNCFFLGGGSNVVFASRVETPIINLMELNKELEVNEDDTVTAGCSVRIQKLINFGMDNSLGGFEYLYSLPASVGGIVFMNAGRGRVYHEQISDWLATVEYLDLTDMKVKAMNIDKTEWTYRCSPFHKMKAVILSATFSMKKTSVVDAAAKIQDRINTVKSSQEGKKPSCGSVFFTENKYLMYLLRGKRIGGAHFSKKTNNWISNDSNGSADDVIGLMNYAIKWHKLLGLKCVPEIKIFK